MKNVNYTREEILEILDEVGVEGFRKGYSLTISTASDVLIDKRTNESFSYIEKIDMVDCFDSDYEASLQAEKDGESLVWYGGIAYEKSLEVIDAILEATREDSLQ